MEESRVTEVMSRGPDDEKVRKLEGWIFGQKASFQALHHAHDSPSDWPQSPATWIESLQPTKTPPGSQIAAESGLLALRRELRHEEIDVVSDSIANSMANHSHSTLHDSTLRGSIDPSQASEICLY